MGKDHSNTNWLERILVGFQEFRIITCGNLIFDATLIKVLDWSKHQNLIKSNGHQNRYNI